jgi:hypothetical protein
MGAQEREAARQQYEAAQRQVASAKTPTEKQLAAEALKRAETRLDFAFGPQSED